MNSGDDSRRRKPNWADWTHTGLPDIVPLLSATILAQALLDHFPQLFFGLVPPHCKLCPPRSRRLLMTSFA